MGMRARVGWLIGATAVGISVLVGTGAQAEGLDHCYVDVVTGANGCYATEAQVLAELGLDRMPESAGSAPLTGVVTDQATAIPSTSATATESGGAAVPYCWVDVERGPVDCYGTFPDLVRAVSGGAVRVGSDVTTLTEGQRAQLAAAPR